MRLVAREEPTHSCVFRSTTRAMAPLLSMLVPLAFVLNLVNLGRKPNRQGRILGLGTPTGSPRALRSIPSSCNRAGRLVEETGGLLPVIKNIFKKTGDIPAGCADYQPSLLNGRVSNTID